jgi:hypothetical protein
MIVETPEFMNFGSNIPSVGLLQENPKFRKIEIHEFMKSVFGRSKDRDLQGSHRKP